MGLLVFFVGGFEGGKVSRAALTGENDDMHRQRAAIIKKTFKKRQSIFLLRWEMLILQTVRTRKNLWIYLL